MILKYDIVANPQKLTQEMKAINERHRVLYWPDHVKVELFDIQRIESHEVDPETEEILSTTISYKRKTQKTHIDDEGIEQVKDVWVDYEFDVNEIDGVIARHNPNIPILTETEKLWDCIDYLLG